MLARKQKQASQKRAALLTAKRILKERGWTYREAAPVLKVHFTHLCRVLTAVRRSRALLQRIEQIHQNKQP